MNKLEVVPVILNFKIVNLVLIQINPLWHYKYKIQKPCFKTQYLSYFLLLFFPFKTRFDTDTKDPCCHLCDDPSVILTKYTNHVLISIPCFQPQNSIYFMSLHICPILNHI